eukprot:13838009-Heterocapsa_arctica.AAC.1
MSIGTKKFLPRPPTSLPRRGARLLAVSVRQQPSAPWALAAASGSAKMLVVVGGTPCPAPGP